MDLAGIIFEAQPCNFVKLDIFWKCSNDITVIFGISYPIRFEKSPRSDVSRYSGGPQFNRLVSIKFQICKFRQGTCTNGAFFIVLDSTCWFKILKENWCEAIKINCISLICGPILLHSDHFQALRRCGLGSFESLIRSLLVNFGLVLCCLVCKENALSSSITFTVV